MFQIGGQLPSPNKTITRKEQRKEMLEMIGIIVVGIGTFAAGAYWGKKKVEHGVFNDSQSADEVSLIDHAQRDAKDAAKWVATKAEELKKKLDEAAGKPW